MVGEVVGLVSLSLVPLTPLVSSLEAMVIMG